jgi:hypothetical protein
MRTRIIPAQITTVEDKIAGNLSLTQLLLLVLPAFISALAYIALPPILSFSIYKLPMIFISIIICCSLAIRIKDKLIINWITIFVSYNVRPKFYVFNKNDAYLRDIDLPLNKKSRPIFRKKVTRSAKKVIPTISPNDLVRLDDLISNPRYRFSIKSSGKGGMHVAFEQEQK